MINQRTPGMSLIVRTVTQLTVGFILLYGIYIITNEHVSPGGGFAGGIIMALAFINVMVAYGKDVALAKVPHTFLSFLGSLGVFLLLGITLLGFSFGYLFLNPGGTGVSLFPVVAERVSFSLLASAVKVGAGISVIFIALVLLRAGRAPNS